MPNPNITKLIEGGGSGVNLGQIKGDKSPVIRSIGEALTQLSSQLNKLYVILASTPIWTSQLPLNDPFYFAAAVGVGAINNTTKKFLISEADGNCLRLVRTNTPYSEWDFNLKPTGELVIGYNTGGLDVLFVSGNKQLGIGADPVVSGTGSLHATGDTARIVDAANTPANSAATGNDGEIRMDNNYIYIHTGGSWRRAPVATF